METLHLPIGPPNSLALLKPDVVSLGGEEAAFVLHRHRLRIGFLAPFRKPGKQSMLNVTIEFRPLPALPLLQALPQQTVQVTRAIPLL